jgi:hypothetical protein
MCGNHEGRPIKEIFAVEEGTVLRVRFCIFLPEASRKQEQFSIRREVGPSEESRHALISKNPKARFLVRGILIHVLLVVEAFQRFFAIELSL